MPRGARSPRGAACAAGELSSGEIAKLAIERGLIDSYRQVFATLFWFTVLPGPAGAVLYRAAALLARGMARRGEGADTTPIAPVARGVRPSGARAALAARLDSGAAHRVVVRDRRRLRGRRASAGARRRRRGRTRRAASMPASCSRAAPARWACSSAVRCPTVGGEPDDRPDLGLGDLPEADLLPSARRTRLARARALAPADAAAHARELGAVARAARGLSPRASYPRRPQAQPSRHVAHSTTCEPSSTTRFGGRLK